MAAQTLCIVGESGTGKSTSLRNLEPETTFIISTTGKPLPFRKWKQKYTPLRKEGNEWVGNYYVSSKSDQIIKILALINSALKNIKTVIIDDFQYVLSYEFVDRSTEVGYGKFSEIAQHAMDILRYAEKMREDCMMVFLTHSEDTGSEIKHHYVIKTIGKMLSEKVTLEGLFTYLFFTKVNETEDGRMEYKFVTNNNGECVAKTPLGMFDDLEIDNDLNHILEVIREYND
jgi:ABC-type dipeptide/oligopeptide/nickel transport system ATPase component